MSKQKKGTVIQCISYFQNAKVTTFKVGKIKPIRKGQPKQKLTEETAFEISFEE